MEYGSMSDRLAFAVRSQEEPASSTRPYMRELEGHLPPEIMRQIFGIVRRGSKNPISDMPVPYVAVVYQSKKVLRFSEAEWLSDTCLARIALECP